MFYYVFRSRVDRKKLLKTFLYTLCLKSWHYVLNSRTQRCTLFVLNGADKKNLYPRIGIEPATFHYYYDTMAYVCYRRNHLHKCQRGSFTICKTKVSRCSKIYFCYFPLLNYTLFLLSKLVIRTYIPIIYSNKVTLLIKQRRNSEKNSKQSYLIILWFI